jgi:uncharacterized protein YbjT (DUF2867 family)
MIFITGGTGFIGRVLTRQLVAAGHKVRLLLQPSPRSPRIPTGVPVEVAVTSLNDVQGLRAALRGTDTIIHLAGGEGQGGRGNLQSIDIDGTRNLTKAATDAHINRFFYLSHLDADRAAGFPVLKAKGIAEEFIRRSGIPYTILRASTLFGPGDEFTTGLAMLLTIAPGIFPLPSKGESLLQPLWVEDFATCLLWSLNNPDTAGKTYDLGGTEAFSLQRIVEMVMEASGKRRILVHWPMQSMRAFTIIFESIFPRFPASIFWLDYLAVDRICALDSIPRDFGLMPARFASRLGYLRNIPWMRMFFKRIFSRYA